MSFPETLSLVGSLAVFAAMFAGFFYAERNRPALLILECDVGDVCGGAL